jgi:hypothetical protein
MSSKPTSGHRQTHVIRCANDIRQFVGPILKVPLPYLRRPQKPGRSFPIALLHKANNRIRVANPGYP